MNGMGVRREDVLVMGNSLGTGVAVNLAHELEMENAEKEREQRRALRGVVLLAPFSSAVTLLDTYMLFGMVPIMAPLQVIPFAPGESLFVLSLLTVILLMAG